MTHIPTNLAFSLLTGAPLTGAERVVYLTILGATGGFAVALLAMFPVVVRAVWGWM